MATAEKTRPPAFPGKRGEMYERYIRHLQAHGSRRPYVYHGYVRRFLEFLEKRRPNRETIEDFMQAMTTEGKKASTRRFIFGVLRSFFNVNDLEWPFGRGESPKIRRGTERAMALHPEAVRQMIRTAVAGHYTPDEAACLALVTTYGLRREDLARIERKDVLWDERLLSLLDPSKDSEPRLHLVPPEILPYLQSWGFRRRLTINELESMWYRLEQKARIPRIAGVGWHSLRRTLNTELRSAVNQQTGRALNPTNVSLFMGWSGRRSSDMTDRYVSLEYVGWGDDETQQPLWRREIDEEVFAVHPFLRSWRGENGSNAKSPATKRRSPRSRRSRAG